MFYTVEHLKTDRFKVLQNYPDSTFIVGEMIECIFSDEGGTFTFCKQKKYYSKFLQSYPQFKKLYWWEEMPLYLFPKFIKYNGKYREVDKWILRTPYFPEYISNGQKYSFNCIDELIPVSEEEYLKNK